MTLKRFVIRKSLIGKNIEITFTNKKGEEVKRTYLGNGRIWEPKDKMQPASEEDTDDLPF